MGAAGVQLGTRFAVSEESPAHPEFKKKYIRAKSRDAAASCQFDSRLPVSPVRAIKNRGTDEFSKLQFSLIEQLNRNEIKRDQAVIKLEEFWMGGLKTAVIDGNVESGSLMAGQSVGLVDKIQTVKEIIEEIAGDIENELKHVENLING
jgi:enoyl-[acyl-carrier protein] reductase II